MRCAPALLSFLLHTVPALNMSHYDAKELSGAGPEVCSSSLQYACAALLNSQGKVKWADHLLCIQMQNPAEVRHFREKAYCMLSPYSCALGVHKSRPLHLGTATSLTEPVPARTGRWALSPRRRRSKR